MIALPPQSDETSPSTRTQAVREPSPSRVVARPLPESQARDTRSYQLQQLQTRFSPQTSVDDDGVTALRFKLRPSDPDFPFELPFLDCRLRVPETYPAQRPQLRVRNANMPRGFAVNVERGWDRLVVEKPGATLLALVNALDKSLEGFLSEQKAETVKLVTFKDTRHLALRPGQGAAQPISNKQEPERASQPPPPPRPCRPLESFTRDQMAAAKARRAQEVLQLEARMGRLPRFQSSADGVVFTVPIEPARRSELCAGLRSVTSLHLIVPLLYPLQQLRIQLNDAAAADADPVEELFAIKAAEQKQMSLTGHVNYLVQNLAALDKQVRARPPPVQEQQIEQPAAGASSGAEAEPSKQTGGSSKGHIQVIPRPPEWSYGGEGSGSDDSSLSDSEEDEEGRDELAEASTSASAHADGGGTQSSTAGMQRGTMLTLPGVELHGLELLEISELAISVKCGRCRTTNDLTGLRSGQHKTISCSKCATPLGAHFVPELVHAHSTQAGVVDVTGARVADMLPSSFIPTCAQCSTVGSRLVTVRGETVTNVCRECHSRFTLRLPEVKFLATTAGPDPDAVGPRRRRTAAEREREHPGGLRAGTALPGRGTCAHYGKSFRWFRFSCCRHVHACDRCYDEAEDHANEWASRMICGWCSREQRYAVDACTFCGRAVVGGRSASGFWEGGKGTRDRRTMSRKDPRKHKRPGGQGQARRA